LPLLNLQARRNALGALLLCATVDAAAEPARYELDREHVTIAFLVEHIGYGVANGLVGDDVELIIEFEARRVPGVGNSAEK